MSRACIGFIAVMLLSSTASADEMVTATPDTLKWGPASDAFEKGGEMAVIAGDPHKSGPFVLRFKMPKGYKIAAHFHPTTEYVTVISGTSHVGHGDKLDMDKGTTLQNGDFVMLPAKMNHFVWTTTPAIVQIQSEGPFAITYVNPADDPRNKKK